MHSSGTSVVRILPLRGGFDVHVGYNEAFDGLDPTSHKSSKTNPELPVDAHLLCICSALLCYVRQ